MFRIRINGWTFKCKLATKFSSILMGEIGSWLNICSIQIVGLYTHVNNHSLLQILFNILFNSYISKNSIRSLLLFLLLSCSVRSIVSCGRHSVRLCLSSKERTKKPPANQTGFVYGILGPNITCKIRPSLSSSSGVCSSASS